VFHSARIKLTLLYTLAIAVIMAAFSIALYIAISTATTSNTEVPESVTPAVEHSILEAQLARARLALLGINVVGWAVAASASYLVAGRTLAPIETAVARQRQFTAHASHELRTPLTVIKGEIDVTRARDRSAGQYKATLDKIDTEVMHLDAMAANLLALARLEGGQAHVDRERGSVAEIAHDVVEPFRDAMRARGDSVSVSIPPDLETSLDWVRVRHLLANLLDNAMRYSPPGSSIRVSAERNGKWVDLSVFNSGSSVEPADLPNLFVPFYRGKGSSPDTGTGLGLALCDWIARSHGGSISARNVVGGVTFTVRLPED
jgi:signal transduction histidine kinase